MTIASNHDAVLPMLAGQRDSQQDKCVWTASSFFSKAEVLDVGGPVFCVNGGGGWCAAVEQQQPSSRARRGKDGMTMSRFVRSFLDWPRPVSSRIQCVVLLYTDFPPCSVDRTESKSSSVLLCVSIDQPSPAFSSFAASPAKARTRARRELHRRGHLMHRRLLKPERPVALAMAERRDA